MTCRFINADSILDAGGILGYNMFAYCSNNPIMRKDPSGKTFLYDPDEPDWASSYNQAQLDMIYRIGIDEFASYDSWVQDAMLYSALMGESFIGDRDGEIHNYLMENAQMGRSHNQFANEYYALVIQEELWNEPIMQMLRDYMMCGWIEIDEQYKIAKVLLPAAKSGLLAAMDTSNCDSLLDMLDNGMQAFLKSLITSGLSEYDSIELYDKFKEFVSLGQSIMR